MPSSAIFVSQSFFCAGVPKRIGSLPRSVASTPVAMPRSSRPMASQTR